jgi:hypothetical protein
VNCVCSCVLLSIKSQNLEHILNRFYGLVVVCGSVSDLFYTLCDALPTEKKAGDDADSDEEEGDGTTSLLSVSACNNTLNLVMRDEGVMRFVKVRFRGG